MVTWQQLLDALRHALNHLYDPRIQRAGALIELLNLAERPNAGLAVQQALVDEIQALKSAPEAPHPISLRRTYEILLFRYVQQWSQQEVADQLGISVRHLRREQDMALQILAQRLADRFQITIEPGSPSASDPDELEGKSPSFGGELAWLSATEPGAPVKLAQALPTILALARPMAQEHGVILEMGAVQVAPSLAVHPVALRQMILSLLSIAIRRAQGRSVVVSAQAGVAGVALEIGAPGGRVGPLSADEEASVGIVRHLLQVCRGHLELGAEGQPFHAALVLPIQEHIAVLVIDDNRDTRALIERYLSGTRYRFAGAGTLSEALESAQRDLPRLIVLDVMMPEMDGWELMGRLREHPITHGVPIVVCTILAEEDLALSLGASGWLRKPVSRETLLEALDRWSGWPTSNPR